MAVGSTAEGQQQKRLGHLFGYKPGPWDMEEALAGGSEGPGGLLLHKIFGLFHKIFCAKSRVHTHFNQYFSANFHDYVFLKMSVNIIQ